MVALIWTDRISVTYSKQYFSLHSLMIVIVSFSLTEVHVEAG